MLHFTQTEKLPPCAAQPTALYREKLFTQGWLQCPWKTRSKGKDESGLPIHTNLEHSFQPDFRRRRIAATVTQDKMLTGLVDALW